MHYHLYMHQSAQPCKQEYYRGSTVAGIYSLQVAIGVRCSQWVHIFDFLRASRSRRDIKMILSAPQARKRWKNDGKRTSRCPNRVLGSPSVSPTKCPISTVLVLFSWFRTSQWPFGSAAPHERSGSITFHTGRNSKNCPSKCAAHRAEHISSDRILSKWGRKQLFRVLCSPHSWL